MAMASSSDGQSVQDWDGKLGGVAVAVAGNCLWSLAKVWTKTKEAEKDVVDKEPESEGEV